MRTFAVALLLAGAASAAFRPLPSLDLTKIQPSMFSDEELDLPYYLVHFDRLANAVASEGPDRGFIRIAVWRNAKDNQPYNARIMENITSLAFFYTTKRPWNVYYGATGLRDRLESALDFWCRIQSPKGEFSEYKPEGWNLAATAFATKFMGRTLRMLEGGPPIDTGLLDRVRAAQRKAILFVLTDDKFFQHGRNYSNQFTNVWPGALAWLSQREDPEVRTWLEKRIAQSATEFQSPVGYFYEAGGPDWSYNFATHHSNLLGAWSFARNTKLASHFIEEERRFIDWLSYNAVPDGSEWVLNRAVETRQAQPVLEWSYRIPLAEQVELARAFVPTREQIARRTADRRRELNRTWPNVPDLPVGEFRAFAPYAFLHREDPQWYPTEAQKKAAISKLPYLRERQFVHQRKDTRTPAVYTFIRRPWYYAAFNSGKRIREQQRYGLGLVWADGSGAILQSQTRASDAAWGTRAAGSAQVYEAADLMADFAEKEGEATFDYKLGTAGRKRVTFGPSSIRVTIEHPGEFSEQLPLLGTQLPRGVHLDGPSGAFENTGATVANKAVTVLRLPGRDRLEYTIRFTADRR